MSKTEPNIVTEIRKKLGLTQAKISEKLGMSLRHVQKLEVTENEEIKETIKLALQKLLDKDRNQTLEFRGKKILIDDIKHDPDEFKNCGAVRVKLIIEDDTAELYEYEEDGYLNRSSDSGWEFDSGDEIKVFFRKHLSGIKELEIEDLKNDIYDIIDNLIESDLTEEHVEKMLENTRYRIMGRDPAKAHQWQLYLKEGDALVSVGHFISLKELVKEYKDVIDGYRDLHVLHTLEETMEAKIDRINSLLDDRSISAEEMLKDWNLAAHSMDDEIRERLNTAMAPCDEVDFLLAYVKKHYQKYREFYCIN